MREWAVPAAVLLALALPAAILVRSTLDAPVVPTFRVSETRPEEAGEALVGPRVVTLDASDPERWVFFDFSRGAVVPGSRGDDWDLAFRRSAVIVNAGDGLAGGGGAQDLGETAFEAVEGAPATGYAANEVGRDTTHAALDEWYDYSFTSHLLMPRPTVYAVRTADGRYAKLRFLSYYCPGPTPACFTFEYVYQGDGSRSLATR